MFVIDCTILHEEVTDFVFDQLSDAEDVECNYEEQTIFVDTGDFRSVQEYKTEVHDLAQERVNDLQRDFDSGYSPDGISEVEVEIEQDILLREEFEISAK